ncbi:MAG: DUF106 domain-containing protein [Candidatus Aenigmarchaeota archaeon]|nr:DUF106 domain-containing protein [Candidatus Aenigmarchaeota archaeon]
MAYYSFLTTLFNPILGYPKPIAELIVAAVFILIVTLFYKFLVNNKQMKELREKQKEIQLKIKQSNPDSGEVKDLTKQMLKLSNKQMKMNLKPMILTFIFILLLVLPWLQVAFRGTVAILPFKLPIIGNSAGWLLWYFICSVPLNQLFRKLLGVM